MCSKAMLLLAVILAARSFGGSSRRTLALACEEPASTMTGTKAALALKNNRYSSNSNNYNYNYGDVDVDAIADNGNNNDNYNYYKALAKWQQQQQMVYGNPSQNIYDDDYATQSQQRQQQQQQGQQGQFDDDPENVRNDFRLQLSDLNAAIQGVGMDRRNVFAGQNNEQDNNVKQEQDLWLPRHRYSRRDSPGQPEFYDDDEDEDMSIDYEGEEDYAVARGQDEDASEQSAQLPYGIQNVRKRRVRSVMPPTQHTLGPNPGGNEGVTYQSLCPTNRVTMKLDMGEYRPNHYVEVTCANNYAPQPARLHNYDYSYRSNELPLLRALLSERGEKREICSATGFSCIQLNRTIHLIRLNEESGCWESETRTVPSGCECMWPKHSYGDIAFYHQAQKRFSSVRGRNSGGADYQPGVGYRQLKIRNRNPNTRSRRDNLVYEDSELN